MVLELLVITCCLVQRKLQFPRLQQAVQISKTMLNLDHSLLRARLSSLFSSPDRLLFSPPVQTAPAMSGLLAMFFRFLFWTLPDASGCTLPYYLQQKPSLQPYFGAVMALVYTSDTLFKHLGSMDSS